MNEPTRELRVTIIGAGFETGNMGVSALANGAISAVLASFPKAKITLFDYGRVPIRYKLVFNGVGADVELLNIRFSRNLFLPNHVLQLCFLALLSRMVPRAAAPRLIRSNRWLMVLSESDVIGALSGGDSFSDIYGMGRLLYVSLPQILVLLLGKPLALLPQTYGPFRGGIGRFIARWIFRRASPIYSRDMTGLQTIASLKAVTRSAPISTFDVAFAMEPLPISGGSGLSTDGLVGLNVSGLLYTRQQSFDSRTINPGVYREILAQLVHFFVTERSLPLVLVPHVLGKSAENDVTAAIDFRDSLPRELRDRIEIADVPADSRKIKYLIGQCEFFVGSRMHACIAALSQGVPAVGIAYSGKFAGVFESIGVGDLVVDLGDSSVEKAVQRTKAIWLQRGQFRSQLAQILPRIKSSSESLFKDLVTARRT